MNTTTPAPAPITLADLATARGLGHTAYYRGQLRAVDLPEHYARRPVGTGWADLAAEWYAGWDQASAAADPRADDLASLLTGAGYVVTRAWSVPCAGDALHVTVAEWPAATQRPFVTVHGDEDSLGEPWTRGWADVDVAAWPAADLDVALSDRAPIEDVFLPSAAVGDVLDTVTRLLGEVSR